jgi:hypothetical protein
MGESGDDAPLNQPSGSLAKLPRLPNRMSGALRCHRTEEPPGRAAPERAALSAALSAAPAGGGAGGGAAERVAERVAAAAAAAAAPAWPTSAPYPAGSCADKLALLILVLGLGWVRGVPPTFALSATEPTATAAATLSPAATGRAVVRSSGRKVVTYLVGKRSSRVQVALASQHEPLPQRAQGDSCLMQRSGVHLSSSSWEKRAAAALSAGK